MNPLLLMSLIPGLSLGLLAAKPSAVGEGRFPSTQAMVLGSGKDAFTIGALLCSSRLDDPGEWLLQVQKTDSSARERISFKDGIMDLYMPGRGCTAWFKQKLEGPIAIVYRVRCPEETLHDPGIQARDINNFWQAADQGGAEGVLDSTRYVGEFGSYNKMLGYYASTGGGGQVGNQTTRFRRYPREVDGVAVTHIALNDHDGQKDFLITPGKWHTVQLVGCQGIAQYIVDGVLVYEISPGAPITLEVPAAGKTATIVKPYQLDEFPAYTAGYFGLRMVGTHHQYADLRIYRLNPLGQIK